MKLLDFDEVRGLMREVIGKLDRVGMEKGEVRPQHSFSIHSEEERRAVRKLLERYRGLSEDQRHQIPALLIGCGREKGRAVGPLRFREYGKSLDELKRAYEIE